MQWNKISPYLISLGFVSFAVTGCASSQPVLDVHSAHFGDITANNISAHRIAPTEKDKANTYIPPNQARQKLAREAYEKGTLKDPATVGTTD